MAENNLLNWTYKLVNGGNDPDSPSWVDNFETTFEGKPVSFTISHNSYPPASILKVYSDPNQKDFVGLATGVLGLPVEFCFVKPHEERGWSPMDPKEAPDLESFVRQYKPIFESQGDLRRTYEHLF